MSLSKIKFLNFIHRIIKTYNIFFNHNPEVGTEPSVGELYIYVYNVDTPFFTRFSTYYIFF